MDNKNYIVKIYKKYSFSDRIDVHYFRDISYMSYFSTCEIKDAKKLTEKKAFKIVSEIEKRYKEEPKNGILIDIDVIDMRDLLPVKQKFTRFEIMDI